jgi:hypothetical protein
MSHYHYWFILSIVFLAVNPQDCYNEIAHKLTTDFVEVAIYSLTAPRENILQEKCQKDLRQYHTPLFYLSSRLLKKSGNGPKRHTGRDEVEIRYPLKYCFSWILRRRRTSRLPE